jgi:hypothetical protein
LTAFYLQSKCLTLYKSLFFPNCVSFGEYDTITQIITQHDQAPPAFDLIGSPFNSSLSNIHDFDWMPCMISDHDLNSCGIQSTHSNSPLLYDYSQIPSTSPLACQSHVLNYLQASPTSIISPHTSSSSSDPWVSQPPQHDSSLYSVSLTSQSPKMNAHPCPSCKFSFARLSDLQRHFDNLHLHIRHHCRVPGCGNNRGRGYCRVEKLRLHLKNTHADVGIRHREC